MIALALVLQAAAAQPPPQRISILAPVPTEPCRREPGVDEIVVCANPEPTQRLPLPGERGPPDGPRRPTGDPRAALDHAGDGACAASQRGCQTGVNMIAGGVAAVRLVGKLIDPDSCCDHPGEATSVGALAGKVGRLFAKKPDKSKRVAIDLDAPPPPTAGRLLQ